MKPTGLSFATHSLVPLLQPFLAPAAPGAIAPSATYALVHRLTSYNEVDEVEVMRDESGKVVGKRFWPVGTRKSVDELDQELSEEMMRGDVGALMDAMGNAVKKGGERKREEQGEEESEVAMRNAARKTLGAHERWRTSAEEYESDEDDYPSPPAAVKIVKGVGAKTSVVRNPTATRSSSPTKPVPSTKLTPEQLATRQATLARESTCQVDLPDPSSPVSFDLTEAELAHHTPPPTMRLTDDGQSFQVDLTPDQYPKYDPRDPRACPPLPKPTPSSTLPSSPSFARSSVTASTKPAVALPTLVAKLKGEYRDASAVVKERETAQKAGQGWKKRGGASKGRNRENEDM